MSAAELKRADILLSSSADLRSLLIRAGELSPYSHAFLFVGHGVIVEAVGHGVERKSLTMALASDSHVVVYRYRNMPPGKADAIAQYGEAQVNKRYNYFGAFHAAMKTPVATVIGMVSPSMLVAGAAMDADSMFHKDGSSLYCSELVVRAYAAAGLDLGVPVGMSTPSMFAGSPKLELLGHLK